MNNPNYKVFFLDPQDVGLNYSIEKWDNNLICETCGKIGSYYMVNDKSEIGSCLSHIIESLGNYYKSIEITELHDLDDDVYEGLEN